VLYLAIPAHNEVATIGVLLWRLRTVLAEFPREYEVVVYDDASTDETADVAEQYAHAMPVTVLRGTSRIGYAGAIDALIRHVSAQTRYPRRDALLLMQGDFTDPPGLVPEFARRFEGGADLVVGERMVVADAPVPVRRLFKAAHWSMRPFVRVDGVRDLTASMRLIRISALRDLVRQAGSAPVCVGDSWTANADLLLKLVPLARRVESVPLEPTYGVRMRETRRIAVRDGLAVLKWAWGARGRRAEAGSAADASGDSERRPPRGGAAGKRRDEPELSVEKLRERVQQRPRVEDEESFNGRREGRRRERERERARSERTDDAPTERGEERVAERPAPAAEAPRTERAAAPERTKPERAKRERAAGTEGEAKTVRPERLPRGQRAARGNASAAPRRPRNEERSPYSDPTLALDDPFAPPAGRRGTRDQDTADTAAADTAAASAAAGDAASADGNTPMDTEPKSAQGSSSVLESRSAAPSSRPESGQTDEEDAADGADSDVGEDSAETAEGTGPRRKRRRNRRSRRGRARKDGAAGDEGSDEGSDEAGDTQGDDAGNGSGNDSGNDSGDAPARDGTPTARPDRPRRSRSRGAAVPTAEGEDTPDGDADDRDDSAEVAGESEEERAARARRRGRRGRRGGARRSRGRRDKDGGESGESGPGDGDGGGGSDRSGSDRSGSDRSGDAGE
jgi:hypothetical protein